MKRNGNGKRTPQRIPEVLSPDEQVRLLAQFDSDSPSSLRGRAILRVFLDTGLRAAELINLRLRDVDLETGRLWVRQGKGRKDRGLWFNRKTREALREWLDSSSKPRGPYDYVFTSLAGRNPLCGRWLRRFVARLGKEAGIEKYVHLHLLRHCFACRLLRETKNLFLVSKALGHADLQSTIIYLHLEDSELEAAMKGLGNGD